MQSTRVSDLLQDGSSKLKESGSETPLLDCRILLAHALGVAVDALYSMYRDPVSDSAAVRYGDLIQQRNKGTPIAYLTGVVEFYGRCFFVDPRVLVPRPETELVVDEALGMVSDLPPGKILDICTGSGCIAISLKAELPDCTVLASDISGDALIVAQQNAQRLVKSDIQFIHSDGVPAGFGPYSLITANPPYVPTRECPRRRGSASSVDSPAWEPSLALDGGPDGLDVITRIASEAFTMLSPGGWLVTEIGHDQGNRVSEVLARIGYAEVSCKKDLAGHDRVVTGLKTSIQPA